MENNTNIFELIKNKKFDDIIILLKKYTYLDINIRDANNSYIIQYIILYNNLEVLKILLEKNCKLDFLDDEGRSILYIPIKYGYFEVIKLLLNKSIVGIPLTDIVDRNGNLPIHYAIIYEDIEIFNLVLKNTIQINLLNNNGLSPLHLSIIKKKYYAVEQLIKLPDININCQNKIGETPLHIACNYEDEQIIDILLSDKNININIIDYEEQITALMYIVALNNINIFKKLMLKNPDLNIQNALGNTVLHIAIIENNYVIANILINKVNNYNLINIDGMTVLHLLLNELILNNQTNLLDKYNMDLLFSKTKLNNQDNYGNTIWHLIADQQYNIWYKYKNILRNTKNNIFIKNSENITPFNMLKKSDKFDMIIAIIIDSYYNLLITNKIEYISDWENKCSLQSENELKCKEYIKTNIFEKNKSVPEKKTSYCVIDDNNNINNTLFTTFTGLSIDIISGLKLLHSKYKIISTLNNNDLIENTNLKKYYLQMGIIKNNNDFYNFEIQWLYQELFFPTNFEKIINKFLENTNINLFIIPLGIEHENNAHANILIYDRSRNTLERFEPNGADEPPKFNYNGKLLDKLLNSYFIKYFKNMTYLSPKMFLPKIGFQSYENIESIKNKKIGDPNGFCAAWTIFYAYYRLKYDVSPEILVYQLIKFIKYNNLSFKNIIRNFSKLITDYRDTIFTKINIDINLWLTDQYTNDDLLKMQQYIIE
jgi:ankyrin repeat protein